MVTDGDGGVKFLDTGKAPRLTASQALRHSFVRSAGGARPAAEDGSGSRGSRGSREGSGSRGRSSSRGRTSSGSGGRAASAERVAASSSGSGSGGQGRSPAKARSGGLMGMWGGLKNRLFDLEARVLKEATATEVQTTVVQQLQADVAAGRASEDKLRREQAALADMQRNLASSVKDLNSVYGAARGFLSGMLGGAGGSKGQRRDAAAAEAAAKAAAPPAADKRMPKWAAKEVPLERVDASLAAAQQRQAAASSSSASWQEDEEDDEEAAAAAEAAGAAAAAALGGVARSAWVSAARQPTGCVMLAAQPLLEAMAVCLPFTHPH